MIQTPIQQRPPQAQCDLDYLLKMTRNRLTNGLPFGLEGLKARALQSLIMPDYSLKEQGLTSLTNAYGCIYTVLCHRSVPTSTTNLTSFRLANHVAPLKPKNSDTTNRNTKSVLLS